MFNIAILGHGYWGRNILRNFYENAPANVKYVCDTNDSAIERLHIKYPGVTVTTEPMRIFNDPAVDAIVVCTPADKHYEHVKTALMRGKHVFVEKPFTLRSADALELMKLADKKGLKIVVDHTFMYSNPVQQIKHIYKEGEIGPPIYIDSVRINLGLFRKDTDVLYDLLPHDLSIVNYILESKPICCDHLPSSSFCANNFF